MHYLCKYAAKAAPHRVVEIPPDVEVDAPDMGNMNKRQKRAVAQYLYSQFLGAPLAAYMALGYQLKKFMSRDFNAPFKVPVRTPDSHSQSFRRARPTTDMYTKYMNRPSGVFCITENNTQLKDVLLAADHKSAMRDASGNTIPATYFNFWKYYDVKGEPRTKKDEPDRHKHLRLLEPFDGMRIARRQRPSIIRVPFLTPHRHGERFFFKLLLDNVAFRSLDELYPQGVSVDHARPYRQKCFELRLWSTHDSVRDLIVADMERSFYSPEFINEVLNDYDEHATAGSPPAWDPDQTKCRAGYADYAKELLTILGGEEDDDDSAMDVFPAMATGIGRPDPGEHPEQAALYDRVVDSKRPFCVFMSGSGGVGKSHTLKAILTRLQNGDAAGTGKRNVLVTSTTGVSALLLDGYHCSTFHHAFGFGPHHAGRSRLRRSDVQFKRLRRANVVVVEEVSMLTATLLSELERLCRRASDTPDRPFGGKSVLLCGDLAQLPPVRSKMSSVGLSNAVFEAPVFKLFELFTLTKVVRQSDRVFAGLLNRLRFGRVTPADLDLLETRIFQPRSNRNAKRALERFYRELPPDVPVAVALNQRLDEINALRTAAFVGEHLGSVRAEDTRSKPSQDSDPALRRIPIRNPDSVAEINKRTRLPEEFELKRGALVMVLRNVNLREKCANGAFGTIVDVQRDAAENIAVVMVQSRDDPDKRWAVKRVADDLYVNENLGRVRRSQFPLKPGWAVTIHKLQGATLDKIVIELNDTIFEDGHAHRCRPTLFGILRGGSVPAPRSRSRAPEFFRAGKPT